MGKRISTLFQTFNLKFSIRTHQITTSKVVERIKLGSEVQDFVGVKAEDLLELFKAGTLSFLLIIDLAVISINDECKVLGVVEDSSEIVAFVEYLRMKNITELFYTRNLKEMLPDFHFTKLNFAGAIFIPLSEGNDFFIFLRKELITVRCMNLTWKTVNWAGKQTPLDFKTLEPRTSFQIWREILKGKSAPWELDEYEVALILQLVYWKFLGIWREKETAVHTDKMKNLLLANVSHEGIFQSGSSKVRTPLNAIINFLEIALEQSMNTDLNSVLLESYKSSKSLIFIVNDLLDLTKMEAGKLGLKNEQFELIRCISQIIEASKKNAELANVAIRLLEESAFPPILFGDLGKLKQVTSN
jgi:light-regulated signal transduction histidine kinase (bacteriophytochrome)